MIEFLRSRGVIPIPPTPLIGREETLDAALALLVVDLLAAGARLKVLITSREALRLRGEHELLVPPLALPDETTRRKLEGGMGEVAALAASPAVALFCQRARATRTAFTLSEENAADIAAICSRLDGLPLAIELAAARVSHLSPGAILERIDRQRSARFSLLTGGPRDAPPRLRTMHDAIAWSHDLLDDRERAVFRQLAVFVGGFSIVAAASVCAAEEWEALDGIRSLIAKSLLRNEDHGNGEPRFGMLETIRAFGLERLAASGETPPSGGDSPPGREGPGGGAGHGGEMLGIRQRHADWYLAFANDAGEKTTGPDDEIWLQRLEVEHANLRAALTWFLEQDDLRGLMQLAAALTPFWEHHAHYREGRRWLEAALTLEGDSPPGREGPGGGIAPAKVRLRALTGAGTMAWYEGDHARAIRWHEQALVLARDSGDRLAEASALSNLGVQALDLADNDRATVYFEASLAVARAASDPRATFFALHNLAQVARLRRQGAAAAARTEEALALARELGEAPIVASALNAFGHAMLDVGDVLRAAASFGESLDLAHSRGNFGDVIDAWEGLARLGAETGLAEEAARLFGAAAALRDAVGVPRACLQS